MGKAATLYSDAVALLEAALAEEDPGRRVMLLSVAACVRDHARDRFSSPSDPWPPELAAEPAGT